MNTFKQQKLKVIVIVLYAIVVYFLAARFAIRFAHVRFRIASGSSLTIVSDKNVKYFYIKDTDTSSTVEHKPIDPLSNSRSNESVTRIESNQAKTLSNQAKTLSKPTLEYLGTHTGNTNKQQLRLNMNVTIKKPHNSIAPINSRSYSSNSNIGDTQISHNRTNPAENIVNKLHQTHRQPSVVTTVENKVVENVEHVYNDLRYRRVCTSVGTSSVLCMTVRFPFKVPLQIDNPIVRYPKPIEPQFYDLDKNYVHVLNQQDWFECNSKKKIMSANNDTTIRLCLERTAMNITKKSNSTKEPVVYLWTRKRYRSNHEQKDTVFHGTGHTAALRNVYNFFGPNHQVLVVGASPAPFITNGIHKMFGPHCKYTRVHREPNVDCDYDFSIDEDNKNIDSTKSVSNAVSHHRRLKVELKEWDTLTEPHVNVGIMDYRLNSGNGRHTMPNVTILDTMGVNVRRAKGWKDLRNLTLIAEYPFAHVQGQWMIYNQWDQIKLNQETLPKYYMDVQSTEGRKILAQRGYQFQHMIVFDGLPQFFPTETNGWIRDLYDFKRKNFTYNGWKPDYGTSCVGPLPQNSILKEINQLSRDKFTKLGHDQRWYGRTWEFVNLFWWQYSIDDRSDGSVATSSDCTHPIWNHVGVTGVHRYFIQAMIDDYFENNR